MNADRRLFCALAAVAAAMSAAASEGQVVASMVVGIDGGMVKQERRSSLHDALAVGALVLVLSAVLLNATLAVFVTDNRVACINPAAPQLTRGLQRAADSHLVTGDL